MKLLSRLSAACGRGVDDRLAKAGAARSIADVLFCYPQANIAHQPACAFILVTCLRIIAMKVIDNNGRSKHYKRVTKRLYEYEDMVKQSGGQ